MLLSIGLDLAKHVFQVHGADIAGSPLFNRKLRRGEVPRFFRKTAFMSGWHGGMRWRSLWAREIANLGHDVRLIPPAYVQTFSSSAVRRTRPMRKPSARR